MIATAGVHRHQNRFAPRWRDCYFAARRALENRAKQAPADCCQWVGHAPPQTPRPRRQPQPIVQAELDLAGPEYRAASRKSTPPSSRFTGSRSGARRSWSGWDGAVRSRIVATCLSPSRNRQPYHVRTRELRSPTGNANQLVGIGEPVDSDTIQECAAPHHDRSGQMGLGYLLWLDL